MNVFFCLQCSPRAVRRLASLIASHKWLNQLVYILAVLCLYFSAFIAMVSLLPYLLILCKTTKNQSIDQCLYFSAFIAMVSSTTIISVKYCWYGEKQQKKTINESVLLLHSKFYCYDTSEILLMWWITINQPINQSIGLCFSAFIANIERFALFSLHWTQIMLIN